MFASEAKKTISSPKIAATTGRPTKPTLPNAVTSRVAPTSSPRVRSSRGRNHAAAICKTIAAVSTRT